MTWQNLSILINLKKKHDSDKREKYCEEGKMVMHGGVLRDWEASYPKT